MAEGVEKFLNIQIGFINDKFEAHDLTDYSEWEDIDPEPHLMLQQLIKQNIDGDTKEIDTTKTIASNIADLNSIFSVEGVEDGWYTFRKIIIPSSDHSFDNYPKLYYVEDDDEIKIYFQQKSSEQPEEVTDFEIIYDLVEENNPDNCFLGIEESMSIYNLINCYVLTESERLDNFIKNNCNGNCNKSKNSLETNADILLAAIMVIKYYIKKEQYSEAQLLLEKLDTCGSLCKKFSNRLKGCGCGRS